MFQDSFNRSVLINYSPISLISSIAKIILTIIKYRLINFLEKYWIISNQQFRFREGKSTEDAFARSICYSGPQYYIEKIRNDMYYVNCTLD